MSNQMIGNLVHKEEPGRQLAKLISPNPGVCLDSGHQRRYFADCCPWLLHKSREAINPGQRPTNRLSKLPGSGSLLIMPSPSCLAFLSK